MEETHLTKRIEDLRSEMNARLGDMNTRITELRQDMNGRFGSLQWTMNVWFIFLTLIMVAFKFIR